VSDVNQVVGFNPLADVGFTEGPSVDGIIGPDLDIVIDLNNSRVRNFVITLAVRRKPETITSNHRTGMNDYPIADDTPRLYGYIGVDDDIIANNDIVPDNDCGMKPNTITDGNLTADNRRRADRKALAVLKFLADRCAGMDPRRRLDRRMKILHNFCKSHHRIVDLHKDVTFGRRIRRDDDGRGQAFAYLFYIFGVARNRNMIGTGLLKRSCAADHLACIAPDFALHQSGNFRYRDLHSRHCLFSVFVWVIF
jgi:hypothetical protein